MPTVQALLATALLIGLSSRAQGTNWLVADNGGYVDVIENDAAVGRVADPQQLLRDSNGFATTITDVAIDHARATAYVTVENANMFESTPVVVVDLATLTATASVTDPNHLTAPQGQAWAVTVSPDGTRVYCTDQTQLEVIDTSNNEVIAVVPFYSTTGALAQGVRISPDGLTAYVRGLSPNTFPTTGPGVYLVDLTTNALTGSVILPNPMAWDEKAALESAGIILTPDGSTLYVVDETQVFAIDTATLSATPIAEPNGDISSGAGGGKGPIALTLRGSTLYVENFETGNPLVVADTAQNTVVGVISLPCSPTGALGTSLDGSEVYLACGAVPTPIAIIDPSTNVFVGDVSDPNHFVYEAETAADPYFSLSPLCGSTPATGCQPAPTQKAQLLLGNGDLSWKWTSSGAVAPSDFGSPPTTTTYVLCIYDASGEKLSVQAPADRTCGTKPCWKMLDANGFKYRDKAGTPDGLTRAVLKAGSTGSAKIQVKGSGANLHLPTLPLTTPARVQLQQSSSNACWEATYSAPTTNTSSAFKAKAD